MYNIAALATRYRCHICAEENTGLNEGQRYYFSYVVVNLLYYQTTLY